MTPNFAGATSSHATRRPRACGLVMMWVTGCAAASCEVGLVRLGEVGRRVLADKAAVAADGYMREDLMAAMLLDRDPGLAARQPLLVRARRAAHVCAYALERGGILVSRRGQRPSLHGSIVPQRWPPAGLATMPSCRC